MTTAPDDSLVHPTAIVAKGAVLGAGTVVGPYCIIGPHVVVGRNNRLHAHVVLEGHTTMGDENEIFPFASIGNRPQDLKFKGEASTLVIGNKNTIREYVTMHPGTAGGGMTTTIGDSNLFMVSSHVGHDGIVGNGNVIANSVALAGHVVVGNGTVLGGLCAIHQFVRIGDFAMLAGGTMVEFDIPPCTISQGDRARLQGINIVGLKRRGYSATDIAAVKKVYRSLFGRRRAATLEARLEQAKGECGESEIASRVIQFCASSSRGVTPTRREGPRRESGDEA